MECGWVALWTQSVFRPHLTQPPQLPSALALAQSPFLPSPSLIPRESQPSLHSLISHSGRGRLSYRYEWSGPVMSSGGVGPGSVLDNGGHDVG